MKILKGGRVMTMAGAVYDPGFIAVDEGKIARVGALDELGETGDAEIIDLNGKWLLPGLIDAHTHVGVGEQGFGREGQDVTETTESVTPQMRAIDGANPNDEAFRDALAAGITIVNIMPGSANVVGGLAFAARTSGNRIDQMVVRHPTGMKAAMGENPKRFHGDKQRMPSTRQGLSALFRDLCIKTQNYIAKQDTADPGKPFERDLKMEQMALVMRRQIPMRIHAHRADDILNALRIKDEFGFDMVLDHATEAFKIPDELIKRGIPAVVGPMLTSRYKVELRERSLTTPGKLVRAGVKVALTTDHNVVPIQYLIVSLILCIRDGLDRDEALKLVTINPAEILRIDDRVGSLVAGKDADISVFSGDPLDVMSRVERVYINGEQAYQFVAP